MAVSKRLRYEVLRRDNHACRYCGAVAPDVRLTVDHVVPSALGGSDEPSNLVAACVDCNAGKSASAPDAPIVDDVRADALRWAAAMQYAAAVKVKEAEDDDLLIEWFNQVWFQWHVGGKPAPRPEGWEDSIRRFIAAGIPHRLVADAAETAMRNKRIAVGQIWRYFCGVCWRTLDDLQEIASSRLEAEEGDTDGA